MKKFKVFSIMMVSTIILSSIGVFAADNWRVSVSSQKFMVNGKSVQVNALNINGSNYLKATEFAKLLDIEVHYDESTNTVSFDKSKPFTEVRTEKGTDAANDNQVVKIDIPTLEAGKYIALDLCDIRGADAITFDITSNGKSSMLVGFMKDKDKFGTTYYGNGDIYGETGIIKSTFTVNGFEGKYYLFVKNSGNKTVGNIKGTVTIAK